MKILANENFPRLAVIALRERGHDVLWAREDMAGAEDTEILSRAQLEERLILTQDKDFGDLAFHWGLPAACGVVLFRLPRPTPAATAERVVDVMSERIDWQGHFAVVESRRVRIRPLPIV